MGDKAGDGQPNRLEKLKQELREAVAALPGALQSSHPELMLDYLATIFKPEDGDAAPCLATPGAAPEPTARRWTQLQQRIASGSEASCSHDEAARRARELEAASGRIMREVQHIQGTLFTRLTDLGPLIVSGYSGASDIVRCLTCGRVLLLKAFPSHHKYCRKGGLSRGGTPTPSVLTDGSELMGGAGAARGGGPKRSAGRSKLSKSSRRPSTPPFSYEPDEPGLIPIAAPAAGDGAEWLPGAARPSPSPSPAPMPEAGGGAPAAPEAGEPSGPPWSPLLTFPVRKKRSGQPKRKRRDPPPRVLSPGVGGGGDGAGGIPMPRAGGFVRQPPAAAAPPPSAFAAASMAGFAPHGGGGFDDDDDDVLLLQGSTSAGMHDSFDLALGGMRGVAQYGNGAAAGMGVGAGLGNPPPGLMPHNPGGGWDGGGGGVYDIMGMGGAAGMPPALPGQHGGAGGSGGPRNALHHAHDPSALVDGAPRAKRTKSLNHLHQSLPSIGGGATSPHPRPPSLAMGNGA